MRKYSNFANNISIYRAGMETVYILLCGCCAASCNWLGTLRTCTFHAWPFWITCLFLLYMKDPCKLTLIFQRIFNVICDQMTNNKWLKNPSHNLHQVCLLINKLTYSETSWVCPLDKFLYIVHYLFKVEKPITPFASRMLINK